MINLFEILNKIFSKLYIHIELLSVDEVIILFIWSVNFRQYVPKKHKRFGIKIYKTCDEAGYTCDMTVCTLFDGGVGGGEISCRVSRFILVNDIIEKMEQICRHEQHLTNSDLQFFLTLTQTKFQVWIASGGRRKFLM